MNADGPKLLPLIAMIDDTPCSLVEYHGHRNERFEATVSTPDGLRLAYWRHGGVWHLDADKAGGVL